MPSIDVEKTGSNIKKITTDKHMTVKEVAEYLGFASPYPVYKWINGKSMPTVDNLVILAELFNTTIEEILVMWVSKVSDDTIVGH